MLVFSQTKYFLKSAWQAASPSGRKESDTTEEQIGTELNWTLGKTTSQN